MMSRSTRTLVDIAALLGIAWLWTAIYESFVHSGVWRAVDEAFGGSNTLPGETAVLATSVIIGWLSLVAVCSLIWCLFLRGRHLDFSSARLMRS